MHAPIAQQTVSIAIVMLLVACGAEVRYGVEGGEWRSYAGDPGSNRYAPLDQIHAGNFAQLAPAWEWVSADVEARAKVRARRAAGSLAMTPLMVGGRLYGITAANLVFALDAGTGRQIWTSAPAGAPLFGEVHRGVTYWRDGDDERIFAATGNAWLAAIDARTGQRVEAFGQDGRVDLLQGLRYEGEIRRSDAYAQRSPIAVYRNTLIVGSSIQDRPLHQRGIPGDVRGYDARTGALRWTFHTVPAEGELGTETWENEAWRYTGAANVWGAMSVDPKLGAVYLTTSTPTNDYYGGHRLGDNLFAESLVCLDAETGQRLWHFQLVRHGVWDYDPGAPANLVDIEVDGRSIPAAAQVTKQGFVFVFDRRTGEPVWPIEDRPVPASDVPGERTSPTQPFPTRPPPFERQGISEADLIDFTPELHAQALALFRRHRTGPLFTPPSLGGTLVVPGANGGSNWMGAGFDPETGRLYVPSITEPTIMSVKAGDPEQSDLRYLTDLSIPASIPDGTWLHLGGLRPIKPPYSQITAYDLGRGEIAWQVPNGNGPRNHPLLAGLKLPRLGSGGHTCVLVTKSLLIVPDGGVGMWSPFGDPILRAYDKASGAVVGELVLPGVVTGCPLTYLHQGVQYVVMAVGGGKRAPKLLALALPEAARRR